VLRRLALVAIILAACHRSPTDPVNDSPTGILKGIVTIGPNCPVQQQGQDCPPPLDAYNIRKVLVYNEAKTKLLFTLDINSGGGYTATLAPGKYTIDMKLVGIDRSPNVPAVVTIHANMVTRLDISVDTGLR